MLFVACAHPLAAFITKFFHMYCTNVSSIETPLFVRLFRIFELSKWLRN